MHSLKILHKISSSTWPASVRDESTFNAYFSYCWAPASATPPEMMLATILPGWFQAKNSWDILPKPEAGLRSVSPSIRALNAFHRYWYERIICDCLTRWCSTFLREWSKDALPMVWYPPGQKLSRPIQYQRQRSPKVHTAPQSIFSLSFVITMFTNSRIISSMGSQSVHEVLERDREERYPTVSAHDTEWYP